MANKRTLKQTINSICEELLVECIAASLYGNDGHEGNNALMYTIIRMQADFTSRISHPEPGMKPNLYYKTLREQFSVQVSDIIDQINSL